MYVDFEHLRKLAEEFRAAHDADGGLDALTKGSYVYSIHFEPCEARVEVHMSWPMFRRLVEEYATEPVDISSLNSTALYFKSRLLGVDCVALIYVHEIQALFEECGLPDEDHPICYEDDPRNLFTLWQNISGWNLTFKAAEGGATHA
jgi:hypothetical protein